MITLLADIWEPGIESGGDAYGALLASLVSRQGEEKAPAGWNRFVRGAILPQHVTVTESVAPRDTLTITLPPLPGYSIDAPEVIDITVPALAIVSRADVPAQPPLLIRATPGTPRVGGSLVANPGEGVIQSEVGALPSTRNLPDAALHLLDALHISPY